MWTNYPQNLFSEAASALSLRPFDTWGCSRCHSEKQGWENSTGMDRVHFFTQASSHAHFTWSLLPRPLVLPPSESLLLDSSLRKLCVDKVLTYECLKYHHTIKSSIHSTYNRNNIWISFKYSLMGVVHGIYQKARGTLLLAFHEILFT